MCFPLAECGSPAAPTRDPRSCSDFWAGMAGRRQLGSSQAPGPHLTLKTGPQGAQVLECRWWPQLGLAGWCVPPSSSPPAASSLWSPWPWWEYLHRGSPHTDQCPVQESQLWALNSLPGPLPQSQSQHRPARAAPDGAVQSSGWRRAPRPGSTCGRDEDAWGPLTLMCPRSPSPELPSFVAVCACQLSLFFAEDHGSCSETRISEL